MVPLHHLKRGQTAHVVELISRNPARLDRLSAFGLMPGSVVTMEQTSPVLIFRIGETEVSIDREVAGEILVQVR